MLVGLYCGVISEINHAVSSLDFSLLEVIIEVKLLLMDATQVISGHQTALEKSAVTES